MAHVHELLRLAQFFEHYYASKALHRTRVEARTQELLLGQMAPPHAIPELLQWFDRRMDVNRAVGHMVDDVCVAFLRLADTAVREGDAAAPQGSPLTLAKQHVEQLMDFILRTQAAVDAVLWDEAAFVAKIKTVGDIQLLAGPFDARTTPRQCGEALLRIAGRLRGGAVAGVSVVGGMHFGTVGSAIIGQSRVAFDIFGDVVNCASRVMTNCCHAPGDVSVSRSFAAAVFGMDYTCDDGAGASTVSGSAVCFEVPVPSVDAHDADDDGAGNPLSASFALRPLESASGSDGHGQRVQVRCTLRPGQTVAMKGVDGGLLCHQVCFVAAPR